MAGEKELQDLQQDPEYFTREYLEFRRIMGSTKYTLEQKDRAFKGLTHLYLGLPGTAEKQIRAYQSLALVEWPMRRRYLELQPVVDKIRNPC